MDPSRCVVAGSDRRSGDHGQPRQSRRSDAPRSARGPHRLRPCAGDDRRDDRRHQTVAAAVRVNRTVNVDDLTVRVFDDLGVLAAAAAVDAAEALHAALDRNGEANVMLATGNSQLAFLAELVKHDDIAWDRVRAFHMDEYVDLAPTHSA